MYHSHLSFVSNQETSRRATAGSTSRFAGAAPSPRWPQLSSRMQPANSSSWPFANDRARLEFELYQLAYGTTRGYSGTGPGPPGLRAA